MCKAMFAKEKAVVVKKPWGFIYPNSVRCDFVCVPGEGGPKGWPGIMYIGKIVGGRFALVRPDDAEMVV